MWCSFCPKRNKLVFLTWHWSSTLSTPCHASGELRAQTVWFPPCRTDGWVPSWSCVFQPRPPGCVGPPAAGSFPTPLSGTGSQSEKNKNKHTPRYVYWVWIYVMNLFRGWWQPYLVTITLVMLDRPLFPLFIQGRRSVAVDQSVQKHRHIQHVHPK